jgi:integrase
MRAGKILTSEGKHYSAGTLKCYEQYLRNYKEYSPELTWAAITLDLYREFIKWCNDKDFSMNYIGQHINKIIVLMKEARKRGWHNNAVYLDGDFKRLREETDDITLTPAELDKIFKQNIPNETRAIARDWFVIGCYLGLRVSDIQLLDTKNFEKDRVTIANEKTDTKVVIPLRSEVKAILKKWGGLPPRITDQEINRSIKEVCEILKFNDVVLYSLTKGGARKDFYLKKWEMVSCHTARRFFITSLLNEGVPDNQVMQLAGIKKHATLLRYKKTKPEETADIMKEHPYFKGKAGIP